MTPNDPELERYRDAFASLAEDASPGEDCPDGERIWQAVSAELPLAERRQIIEHVIGCPECSEAWRLARELGAEVEVPAAVSEPTGRETPRARRVGAGLWERAAAAAEAVLPRRGSPNVWGWAAATATAAALLLVVGSNLFNPAPTTRGEDDAEVRSLVPEDQPLPRDDFRLRWTPAPEGSRYRVSVMTEALEPIVTAGDLAQPELVVSADELAGLAAGAAVLWRVEVELPDGGTRASPTFVSRLAD